MGQALVTERYSESLYFGYDLDPDEDKGRCWSFQCNGTFSRDCGFFVRYLHNANDPLDVGIESKEWREMEVRHTAWHLSRIPSILFWEGED